MPKTATKTAEKTRIKVVDNYELAVEEHDGFKFVHLKLALADGTFVTYEFPPPYAHTLSDELCKTAAHAAAK